MTAFGSEETAVRALMAGAASYVTKDRLLADLVDTIRQILAVSAELHKRRRLLASKPPGPARSRWRMTPTCSPP